MDFHKLGDIPDLLTVGNHHTIKDLIHHNLGVKPHSLEEALTCIHLEMHGRANRALFDVLNIA